MVLLFCATTAAPLTAQTPGVHYRYQGLEPPGAIGSWQLQRGGPLSGYSQPVEIKAPQGALVSLASEGKFCPPEKAPLAVGLFIGPVYRLRITNIPLHPGREVFPTIEVIDRLYPPPGQALRFPIPIELTQVDLELALEGKFVTRVVYLENPLTALPVANGRDEQRWFDAGPGSNPLEVADRLGRPVAIVRLGGRLPENAESPDMQFLYGAPPYRVWGKPADMHRGGEGIPPGKTADVQAMPAEQQPTQTTQRQPSTPQQPPQEQQLQPPVAKVEIRVAGTDAESSQLEEPEETRISDKQRPSPEGKLR